MSQKEIFLKSEGNNWFERNKEKLISNEEDLPILILNLYSIKPKKVLEIGCSNGFRLSYLKNKFGCECVGVEPSESAIEDGNKRFEGIKLIRGVCSDVPIDEKFDLIIVHFVLHWVDREDIATCVDEIDRLLEKGGYLVLGDFFPDEPIENKYHHLLCENVMTFKQDYANVFVDLGNYIHISHLSTTHNDVKELKAEKESNERVSVSLLLKK